MEQETVGVQESVSVRKTWSDSIRVAACCGRNQLLCSMDNREQ